MPSEVEVPVLDAVLGKTLPFKIHWQLVKQTPQLSLSKHQFDTFWKQGHLSIPNFIDPAEVDEIGRVFRRLFDVRAGWKEGHFYDMAGSEQSGDFKLPQLIHLTRYAPELLRTNFWANADALARKLLGPTAHFSFDHGIDKPVRPDSQTPWHQDQAFHRVGSRIDNITIWLPLQEVTPDSGCLKFIPGSHLTGMVKHRNYQNDSRIECLEALGVNDDDAVHAPLPKGGVSIHHSRTLHAAGPNLSRGPRRIYAVVFAVKVDEVVVPVEYDWNSHKPTARLKRQQAFDGKLTSRVHQSIRKVLSTTLHSVVR
jgi:ectoine hydroxylase-related dioxygenase (phytanoyl-CoA dioxygenase family)